MSGQLVVVITGAGRGIGNALAQAYLLRENCTVVGSIRDHDAPGVVELKASPKGSGSQLLLVKIESSVAGDAAKAVEEIKAAGIDHIDILIANAGLSPPVIPLETVGQDSLTDTFNVNALGPLALYQACLPLLQKSSDAKFVPISSAAGSIGAMESNGAWVAPAYSISKAMLNWVALAAHCGNAWLTSFAVNPGLVATDMGNNTAKYLGLERAPYTKEFSAEKIIGLINDSTREKTSGKFINAIDGAELPW
ncbi:putative short-chain dehydrogenase reductase SDR [Rosellinia necatrix]|uniref:Putative short-chain dehydrogenase reductase SDR n=1 Tax=Rosellinia necatrix TaxID=77044 RepID=A0A1W2TFP5_ROSNE|nr:putative short-chain dehydrogenase reductase SDR [Rosellinia necatrix]